MGIWFRAANAERCGVARGGTVLVPLGKGHAANLPFPCTATGARHSVNAPCTRSKPHGGSARSALGGINYFTRGKGRKDTGESNSLYPKPSPHLQRAENSTISISGTAEMVIPATPEHLGDIKLENQPKSKQQV